MDKCGSGVLSERMVAKRRIRYITVPLDPRGDGRDVGGQVGGRRAETGGDGRGRAGTDNGKKGVTGQACGDGDGWGWLKAMECVPLICEGGMEDGRGRAEACRGVV